MEGVSVGEAFPVVYQVTAHYVHERRPRFGYERPLLRSNKYSSWFDSEFSSAMLTIPDCYYADTKSKPNRASHIITGISARFLLRNKAAPRRSWMWIFTYRIGSVPHFGTVQPSTRTIAGINEKKRGLGPTETEVNGAFSHDVTAAILVFRNNETSAMLVYPENPLGVELFSHVNAFFCSNKLA